MSQTFEEKVGATILAYGARSAMQNWHGSTTPAQDYRDAVKAIIKLIEEEVSNKIIGGNYSVLQYRIDDADQQRNIGKNELVAEQRRALDKLIKGE